MRSEYASKASVYLYLRMVRRVLEANPFSKHEVLGVLCLSQLYPTWLHQKVEVIKLG